MKHRTKILALLLLLTLLWGCTTTPAETKEPSVPQTTISTADPHAPELLPELSLESAELAAVQFLSDRSFAASPEIAVLDQRTAAFLTTEYDKSLECVISHLMVLDLFSDTVLGETTLEYAVSFPTQSQLPGYLPVYDTADHSWIIFNKLLQTVCRFAAPDGGVFTPDFSDYYFIKAQRICRMDPFTGEAEYLNTELTLPVEDIIDYDLENQILLVNVHTQYYLTQLCLGAVDLNSGKLLLLNDDATQCFFSADGVFLESTELSGSPEIIHANLESDHALRLSNVIRQDDVNTFLRLPFTDYLMTLHYNARKGYTLDAAKLYRFGDEVNVCELYELMNGMEPELLVSLPGGNLLAADYGRRKTELLLICPEKLTFESACTPEAHTLTRIDHTIPESYAEQSVYVDVPQALAEVRARADILEATYGITILMSNQCDSIISQLEFKLNPTDKADLENEAKLLHAALDDLEKSLKLYPDGFFPQFRNEADERGILVMLVEDISAGIDDENVDTLGVTYRMGDWYPIAVDITTKNKPATYCHEIWHAMENKIRSENPSSLSEFTWAQLNPSGFVYQGIVEGYYYDTEHTYIDGNAGKKSYFVDSYGKTMPQEDRARLMEYVMTTTFSAEGMMRAPVLHEKMGIMIHAVRSIFDTTGWKDVYWERFHS